MATNDAKRNAGRPRRMAGDFYGRRKSRPLKPAQRRLFDTLLPKLAIDTDAPQPEALAELFPHNPARIDLEIGFGAGEHLVHRAQLYPQIGFIGCEPFINGMAKALSAIDSAGLKNIRLHPDDAALLLDWLPEKSIDRIDLLYPDPWPKKKHWKRRFANAANLDRFACVLKPGGEFRFASDIDHYVNWTLVRVFEHGGFDWTAECPSDWRRPWPEWLATRYEQKAIREGRAPAYLTFRKRS